MIRKGFLQSADLLEADHLVQLHAQILADLGVVPPALHQLTDDVGHIHDLVRAAGAVVADGTGDTLVNGLVDHRDRQLRQVEVHLVA